MRFRRVLVLMAGVVLLAGVAASQRSNTPEARLRAAMDKETVDGDLKAAIDGYKQVISQRGASREVVAQALLRLGMAMEKQGDAEARRSYERLTREFTDQNAAVQQARARMAGTEVASVPTLRQICVGDSCDGVRDIKGHFWAIIQGNVLTVRDTTTATSHQVAAAPAGRRLCCSEISPDGTRIAYSIGRVSDGLDPSDETIIANIDGSGVRTVYRGGLAEAWSADGQRILVYTRGTPTAKIGWVMISTGAVEWLSTAMDSVDLFKVSPDGKYVAFSGNKEPDTEENVYVMAVDGSGETRISPSPVYQEPIGWSPDGKYLLYGQYGSTSNALWAAPIANGRLSGPVALVKPFGKEIGMIGISSTGTLLYQTVASEANLYTASMDRASGKVTPVPALVPTPTSGSGTAAWSPDSRQLAYLGNGANGTREIHVFSPEDGADRRVPTNATPVTACAGLPAIRFW
jgi:Tol biopolymer transport system component